VAPDQYTRPSGKRKEGPIHCCRRGAHEDRGRIDPLIQGVGCARDEALTSCLSVP